MNIQIFGSKKCFDTKKAERYFKERKIKYQYIDILRFGLSKGELKSVSTAVGLTSLVNSKLKTNSSYSVNVTGTNSLEEKLLVNPKLISTPIVRNGKKATVGYCPEIWSTWD
jgi:arsenate reductase